MRRARATRWTSSAGRAARAAFSSRCCTRRCSRMARSRRACCCPTCRRTTKASQPENFDRQYRGAVRADEALAHSLNVPAVRMLKTYGVARFADLLRGAGMTHADAPRRRLRPHADPRRRRRQSLGRLRRCTPASPASRAPAPPDADTTLPRAHGSCATPEPQTPRPLAHRHRRGLADARSLVRGAAARRGRSLAQLRLQSPHRLEDRHQCGACATAGRSAAPAATRWRCGWAMPAARAARASPARPWPRR